MENPVLTGEQHSKIMNQINNCVCKIQIKDIYGTGFFCNFSVPNKHTYIHALITNYHVINENTIKKGIPFKIEFNNNKENRIIKINKDRKV